VLLRRDVYEQVGGFDPALWQFEDWDLYIRMSRHGDFAFVNKVVVDYRRHSAQSINNPWNIEMFEVIGAKTTTSALNTPYQRRVAMRTWRLSEFYRALGLGYWASGRLLRRQFAEAVPALKRIPMQLIRCLAGPIRVRIPER
jgi:GT2 family glycosyltransferase